MLSGPPLALAGDWTTSALVRILGYSLYACVVGIGLSFVFRRVTRRQLPTVAAIIATLALTTVRILALVFTGPSIVPPTSMFHYASAAYLLGVFVASTIAAEVGRRIGDFAACDVFAIQRVDGVGPGADVIRAASLAVPVTLPETISDLEGYEPVPARTKQTLEGERLLFPRRLSRAELASRLETRLVEDYAVDHVYLDLESDATVSELAVGAAPEGLSPQLAPGVAAVAVEADPAGDARVGDPVEVWSTGSEPQLVTEGTLRSTVGDVATIAVDGQEASKLDHTRRYRLLTRPDTSNDARALATRLWDADATVTAVEVVTGGPLEGEFVDWLPARVLTVERDGEPVAFPDGNETLAAGDTVYLFGNPRDLQELSDHDLRSAGATAVDVGERTPPSGSGEAIEAGSGP